MIRSRLVEVVKYGSYRDALEAVEELNRILEKRGLQQSTLWTPIGGKGNQLIIESEYPTLSDYESELKTFYSDPDIMNQFRKVGQYLVDGKGREDLVVTVTRPEVA